MQLKYTFKRGIVYLLLFFGFTALLIFLYPRVISVILPSLGKRNLSKNELCPECEIYFQDKQAKQERAYRNEGIKPQKELSGLDRLKRRRILMVIPDRKYFKIDNNMIHSRPYLLPKAISFLYFRETLSIQVRLLPTRGLCDNLGNTIHFLCCQT